VLLRNSCLVSGPIIRGRGRSTLAGRIEGLVLAVADILESTVTISLLSLDLPVDKPECMDVSRDVSKNGQTDVDEQITAATCNEPSRCRWEQDGYDDEKNVCSFNHCGLLVDEVHYRLQL